MRFTDDWDHYRELRLQAFFGTILAAFLLSLPWGLNRFTVMFIGHTLPAWLFAALTLSMVGLALIVAAEKTLPWLYWACPGCSDPFFACGPRIAGTDVFVNHFKSSCRTCELGKWMSSPPSQMRRKNVVTFEDFRKMRDDLKTELRKRA
jgi:hypothetical protein